MLGSAEMENRLPWSDENRAILPIMTALFVDGLGPKRLSRSDGVNVLHKLQNRERVARIFRLSLPSSRSPARTDDGPAVTQSSDARNDVATRKSATDDARDRQMAARALIRGISHHFNNLLMGIWGNATLIRLQLTAGDPLYERMMRMERLIQSSAYLIHMVLGYLGERRATAKRLLLNQLIMEMKQAVPGDADNYSDYDFEARLKWASRVQRPGMIASSSARVLDFLFKAIHAHSKEIMVEHRQCGGDFLKKMGIIDGLVGRGLGMARQLRNYAKDAKPDNETVRLAYLLKHLL